MLNTLKPIQKPFEPWELEAFDTDCTGECNIDCVVEIDLNTLFEGIEITNDYVSEAITGTVCLQDINYEPVSTYNGHILLRVTGYIEAEDIPHKTEYKLTNKILSHILDFEDIVDSMLVDSGTEILSLSGNIKDKHGVPHHVKAAIETAGDVRVFYKNNFYCTPSEFPQELKDLIRTTKGACLYISPDDYDIECMNNNWFECCIYIDGNLFDDPGVFELITPPEEIADTLENHIYSAIKKY